MLSRSSPTFSFWNFWMQFIPKGRVKSLQHQAIVATAAHIGRETNKKLFFGIWQAFFLPFCFEPVTFKNFLIQLLKEYNKNKSFLETRFSFLWNQITKFYDFFPRVNDGRGEKSKNELHFGGCCMLVCLMEHAETLLKEVASKININKFSWYYFKIIQFLTARIVAGTFWEDDTQKLEQHKSCYML